MKKASIVVLLFLFVFCINLTPIHAQTQVPPGNYFLPYIAKPAESNVSTSDDWPMVAANPERTSWTPEEVRGELQVAWYRPIEPFIHPKFQVIAANGTLYISSAKGLYALRATNGDVLWVYPTEMPLGNSPTIATVGGKSIAYVGGFDRKIHAIEANPDINSLPVDQTTGFRINNKVVWMSSDAGAGFETNPLVIDNTLYAGNRDGYFYAFDAATGLLKWKFQTAGPISFSAAYKDGTLYFASNDAFAYAINAADGKLVWKSQKLPGDGFHTFWPVIYTEKLTGKDYVIFTGGENYRFGENETDGQGNIIHYGNLTYDEGRAFFPCWPDCPWGNLIGTTTTASDNSYWASGTVLMDLSKITNYYEDYPYRRTAIVLDRATGEEYQFDSDSDGKLEYAPFSWSGATHSGSKYPPIIGADGVYYQDTTYASAPWIVRGDIVGWKFGTHFASRVMDIDVGHAVDEPIAFSSGGNLIYWAKDYEGAGSFDITIPYGQSGPGGQQRAWHYYDDGGNTLPSKAPGYDVMYYSGAVYGSNNGVYVGAGGSNLNPLVPYNGMLYLNVSNAIIAFSPKATTATKLPLAGTVSADNLPTPITPSILQQRLTQEVQKMLAAGPLRPGYHASGIVDQFGLGGFPDDQDLGEIFDYFQNPSDTVVTLIQVLPYLSPALQNQVKAYLQTNYGPGTTYDFTRIVHIGWKDGAAREILEIPPEVENIWHPLDPSTSPLVGGSTYWKSFPPYSFYAAWKYAQVFGGAKSILDSMQGKLETPPSDSYLISHPYINNLYIAGYLGFLELQKLAGYPESASVRNTYNHLLGLRVNNFSKDNPWGTGPGWAVYQHALNIAFNFMFLTPELAEYLNQNALTKVQQAMDEYTFVAPYWFVSKFDSTWNEGTLQQLYDYPALFQAKAYILDEPYNELVKYIDVPAFYRGDLFYIQNLVAALSAAPSQTFVTTTHRAYSRTRKR